MSRIAAIVLIIFGSHLNAQTPSASGATPGGTAPRPNVAAAINYDINATFVPRGVTGAEKSMLYVDVKLGAGAPPEASLAGKTLKVVANGYQVDPPSVTIPAEQRTRYSASFVISHQTLPGYSSREAAAFVQLSDGPTVLTSQLVAFTFSPLLDVARYLVDGVIGIILGYLLRLVIKILKKTAPADRAAAARAINETRDLDDFPTPLETFIARHFYLIDCLTTIAIGLLVLLSLMQDGRPPASTAFWHNALTLGVGLGALTNSDLITRIHA